MYSHLKRYIVLGRLFQDGNDALALAENRKYLDVVKLLKRQKTTMIAVCTSALSFPAKFC